MPRLVSLPVAGNVSTTPTGMVSFGHNFPSKKSHTSPLYFAPIPIAFAESTALPPPTASIKSIFSSLHIFIPSLTRLNLGFGLTPPSSTTSIPASVNYLITLS